MKTACLYSVTLFCTVGILTPVEAGGRKAVTVQGRVVRLTGPDQFIVQTRDGKEVTFYGAKDTRYLLGDKTIRYSDLRVGSDVTAAYVVEGDRYVANTVTVAAGVEDKAGAVEKGMTIRG